MDTPAIRYARTDDGVSVAYLAVGDGPQTVVSVEGRPSHIEACVVRGALDEHGGREVKHTGDGIMASFPSAVSAVTAALQIRREMAAGEVRVRVGRTPGNQSPRTTICSVSA